jgi:pre-rRNA-processing protein TSR2
VQNNWGGPDSSDKRDWFAGAVVELFPDVSALTPAQLQTKTASQSQQPQQPAAAAAGTNGAGVEEPDQEDVEAVLLQVMLDEFEVNVEDDSAFEVAEQVVRMRGECLRGKFDEVEALRRRWEGKKGGKVVFKKAEDEEGDETDWSSDDDEEEEEEGEDVEMGDAPPARKEREEPEVDDEGFTKVSRKKR